MTVEVARTSVGSDLTYKNVPQRKPCRYTGTLRFCQMWLMSRLLPRSEVTDVYVPVDTTKYKDVVVIRRETQGLFSSARLDNYLTCCENIDMTAVDNMVRKGSASEHVLVIELHYASLKHETVMPVYTAITMGSEVYCFIATKLVIECMTAATTIMQLLHQMQIQIMAGGDEQEDFETT